MTRRSKTRRRRLSPKNPRRAAVDEMLDPRVQWLRHIQTLIQKHSTPPRKSGKFKGHSSTDVVAWIGELASDSRNALSITKSSPFDENMAIAQHMGSVLLAWWVCCQRAKTFDPNRPLSLRRQASVHMNRQLGQIITSIFDDELMGSVFGTAQDWNFPFGRCARGGKFV